MTWRGFAKLAAINVAVLAGLLVLIEGASSLLLLGREVLADDTPQVAETRHARYDPDLGWVNVPGTYIADMYGEAKSLRINSQGFRGDRDYSLPVPSGKLRIVCSGDSFTLGFGVGDRDTWCALLESMDARLETLNMGEGGYGVDQAYLWYMRDGRRFAHDVQLFALIGPGFQRMQLDAFLGRGKPFLTVENGELVTHNTPVPKASYLFDWLTRHAASIDGLRLLRLLHRQVRPIGNHRAPDAIQVEDVLAQILLKLHEVNAAKGSTLVVVYLPSLEDLDGSTAAIRRGLAKFCARNGWPWLDLTPDVLAMPAAQRDGLFIGEDQLSSYVWARGHYTEQGNRFVARRLYEQLVAAPAVGDKLRTLGAVPGS
jgi:hypothetical protein